MKFITAVFIIFFLLSCSSKTKPSADSPALKKNSTYAKHDYKGWTTFRGNKRRTGQAHTAGPRQPKLKWVFRTGGRIYADAAVSPDGTVYVASHDHKLYAVTPDGYKKWEWDGGGKIWTTPLIAPDGTIFTGSDDDKFAAISPAGKTKWILSTRPETHADKEVSHGRYDVDTSCAMTSLGTLIFGCHNILFAVMPGGLVKWQFSAGTEKDKIFSSPALGHDDSIYFGTQGNYLFGLDKKSNPLWHVKTDGDNDSTPVVGDDGTVYFGSDDGYIRAIAPGGKIKWKTSLAHPVRAPLSLSDTGVLIVPTYGNHPFIAAVSVNDGRELWRFHTKPGKGDFFGIQSGALIDSKGYIYFGGRDHFIYCVSPDGEFVWSHETGDHVDSGPVMGRDGTLYVGSDDKRLYAFASQ